MGQQLPTPERQDRRRRAVAGVVFVLLIAAIVVALFLGIRFHPG